MNDLIGKQFSRWKVIKFDEIKSKEKSKAHWVCECSCEDKTIRSVNESNLKNNISKSCGCLRKEKSIINGKKNKKYNKYDLTREYGIGYLDNGYEFYFDLEDYNKIKDYCWHKHKDGYLRTCYEITKDGKHKYILMHRLIYNNISKEFEVDHINGKPNDNRKFNLRKVIHSQNAKNIKIFSSNKSGYKGVNWNKLEKKWKSMICVDGNAIHLGTFDSKEKAILARKEAEEFYFNIYSRKQEDIKNGTR